MNEPVNTTRWPSFASMCAGSHNTSREIGISKQIEIAFLVEREREQREPLLLHFLVRKQCLVSRLMKQREISVFHRIRGLLPRTCFALRANPREFLSYASCINFRLNPRIFRRRWLQSRLINKQKEIFFMQYH